jgi:dipeptidyl aminopeptidase/acylaminoacyl peptidase
VINRIFKLAISLMCLAPSTLASQEPVVSHHELIKRMDSPLKQVEIYWTSPVDTNKRLPAIIYIHGVQGGDRPGAINMANGGLLNLTTDLGYFAVAMSMPGYGQSSGKADFCGRESQAALRSVLQYLRTRPDIDSKKMAVSGLSCGAIVAAMVADREPIAAMILVSGVYDFEDMYEKWQTPAWKLEPEVIAYVQKSVEADGGLEKAAKYRSALLNAPHFKMPVLLVAGAKDRIVDTKQSSRLAEATHANGHSNQLVLNPDGEHMISYESWALYSADFLRRSSSK